MYVWSKRIVITLLVAFGVLELLFWLETTGGGMSELNTRTTHWLALNYLLLLVWVFVWMFDQARVRGKNVSSAWKKCLDVVSPLYRGTSSDVDGVCADTSTPAKVRRAFPESLSNDNAGFGKTISGVNPGGDRKKPDH